MSKKTNQAQTEKGLEGIESALTRTELFIESNSKTISIVIFAAVLVVVAFIGIKRLYLKPLEEEAASQMFMAERFFDRDSFNLALNGYGTYPGFLAVIDDYGITKSANLASYYAGICYLKLGDFNNALEYLEKFNTKDLLLGAAQYGAIGDAYAELDELGKSLAAYRKGIESYSNDFSTPFLLMKEGILFEKLGEFGKAAESYKQIKREFPESTEARDIDRYIARAELRAGK
jgi:tetratricopeptide (TPR) repeat protein